MDTTAARNGAERGEATIDGGAGPSLSGGGRGYGRTAFPGVGRGPGPGGIGTSGIDTVRGDPERADTVVLTLPASGAYLSVLRTATAGLAARLQFTLDEIEDLRIAVDEACAMLLTGDESPDTLMTCRFLLTSEEIMVTVTLPSARRALPSRETFAWQVLTALAGQVDATANDGHLEIQLVKRRGRTP